MREQTEVATIDRRESENDRRKVEREISLVSQSSNKNIVLPVGQENVCEVPPPLQAESAYATQKSQP